MGSLKQKDWQKVTLRNGTKGVLEVEAYMQHIFVFDEIERRCSAKLVIVSREKNCKGKWEYKYAFSNAKDGCFKIEELAYMLCYRFWIEQSQTKIRNDRLSSERMVGLASSHGTSNDGYGLFFK